jgi:predicted TIM-barrel fold metal-dependent hydrolase
MTTDAIDVHAHFLPDFYQEALTVAGYARPDGIPALPSWGEAKALAAMNRLGIGSALLSISSPGVHFGDRSKAVELARGVNEAGARIARNTPDRFGFFATLPLPEIEDSIEEARHALDELNADGVVLLTNHHGMYPGDERLEPLYAALNARSAVIFIHPTSPQTGPSTSDLPAPVLEFMFETTRAVTDLVLSGVMDRFPRLRIIVPHAGATLAVLASRIDMFAALLSSVQGKRLPPNLRASLAKLDFDLAGCPVDEQLGALVAVADPTRLHYGSDYPFTPESACQVLRGQLLGSHHLDAGRGGLAFTANSGQLFPRLRVHDEKAGT